MKLSGIRAVASPRGRIVVAAVVLAACYAARGTDLMLGVFEIVAVPVTLVRLLLACTAHPLSRTRLRRAAIAALVVGMTVAQPFGAVATASTSDEFVAGTTTCVSTTGWHVLAAGPIPVPFHLYVRHHFGDVEDAGDASSWIRVRTWLGPLTNASDVLGTEDDAGRAVQLCRARSGGYVVQDGFSGATAEEARQNLRGGRYVAARLGFGVASSAGLVYWIAVGALFTVSAIRAIAPARRP